VANLGDLYARADELLQAVQYVDSLPRNRRQQRGRGNPGGVPATVTVRVTSATANAAGYYAGVVTVKDASTGSWSDLGPVSIASRNGDALAKGRRYGAVPCGIDPSDKTTPALLTDTITLVNLVTSVCPVFTTIGGVQVVQHIVVQYQTPDGDVVCVTDPTGCCASGNQSGGGVLVACCPGAVLPSQMCATFAGWLAPLGSVLLTWDGVSLWDNTAGWAPIPGGATLCGATQFQARLQCIAGSGFTPCGDIASSAWVLAVSFLVPGKGVVPVCAIVAKGFVTCSPFSATFSSFEGSQVPGGDHCADFAAASATVTADLTACGGGGGGGGCTGAQYDASHPHCCPGVCWSSPLHLTVSGHCATLNGTYPLSVNTPFSDFVSAGFTYNARPARWDFGCVDASGGNPAGEQLVLVYTDNNTNAGFAIVEPSCGPPPSASGTLTPASGPCNGLTLNWSVTT
jgi:hypothetical protein